MKTMQPCYRQHFYWTNLNLAMFQLPVCNHHQDFFEPDEDIAIINLSGESPSNLVHWSCTMPKQ